MANGPWPLTAAISAPKGRVLFRADGPATEAGIDYGLMRQLESDNGYEASRWFRFS